MTKGDRFASGKGGGKHSNFFVSGRIIYTVCFSEIGRAHV